MTNQFSDLFKNRILAGPTKVSHTIHNFFLNGAILSIFDVFSTELIVRTIPSIENFLWFIHGEGRNHDNSGRPCLRAFKNNV